VSLRGRSPVVGALFGAVVAYLGAGCSGHQTPPLGKDCSGVFAAPATSAEGACSGADGTIHVSGADCHSGPRFMLAEHASTGEDYAWARVGQAWHMLTADQTSEGAYKNCAG
jgi:hypothetical protein